MVHEARSKKSYVSQHQTKSAPDQSQKEQVADSARENMKCGQTMIDSFAQTTA